MKDEEMSNAERVEIAHRQLRQIRGEVERVIVGQEHLLDMLLISLLTQGHSLLIGVPGLAKTRSVRALADALDGRFSRIQFTPDLLPSDITGSEILDSASVEGGRGFRFEPGPVFANLVLADEINRTPPRTQAALLESMQERAVTVGNHTHPLPEPFLVLATQNPIEQEGTFPLPEAQLDRFFFSIQLDYPSEREEREIISRTTAGDEPTVEAVCSSTDIVAMQRLTRSIRASDEVISLAIRLVRQTRPEANAQEAVRNYVAWGAGPRASQDLILGAKARALMEGRDEVGMQDILGLIDHVLGHRMILNFTAERDGVGVPDVIEAVRRSVTVEI